MNPQLILPFEERYAEYLHDESKLTGAAQSISFARTKEEIAQVLRQMAAQPTPVTIQGGKTGICGGAVPQGGHILNLSLYKKSLGLRKADDCYELCVQAGMTIDELKKQLSGASFDTSDWDEVSRAALTSMRREGAFFFPSEPTETSATVGGVLAANAQGICAPLYGDTRRAVRAITVLDGSGNELRIERGQRFFQNGSCALPDGRELFADAQTLSTAFGLTEGADVLDFFLGSEGKFGVIAEATLRVVKMPAEIWGIAFFFVKQDDLFGFAEHLRANDYNDSDAAIAAAEYIDRATLEQIARLKKVATKLKGLPDAEANAAGMVYVELHGSEKGVERIAESLMERANECGCAEDTWALSGIDEVEKLRAFRHAAPESINIAIEQAHREDARILKLSTDIAYPVGQFGEVVRRYERDISEAGVSATIFGHILQSHVHVNILAKTAQEYEAGKALIASWTKRAAVENGVAFTENGVGKLKKELFALLAEPSVCAQLRALKAAMDPRNILNPANMPCMETERDSPC